MYGVMIIDDDAKIRSRLKTMIDWEHLPIEFVCEAADSDTARDLYLVYRPKIIITDIFIPIINGLDLAEELAKIDPEIRFIIITGYDDFANAKRAVKLGAVDLISKPLFSEAVNESIRKAVQYFEKLQKDSSSIAALQELLQENLHDIQDSYVGSLLHEEPKDPERIEKKLRDLRLPIRGPRYAAALVSADAGKTSDDGFEAIPVLLKNTISNILNNQGFEAFSYMDSRFRVSCVINIDKDVSIDDIEAAFNLICDEMKLTANCSVFAGIGNIVDSPETLHLSYNQALNALNYQRTIGGESVILYKNITKLVDPFPKRGEVLDRIAERIHEGNCSDLENIIRGFVHSLFLNNQNPEDAIAQMKSFMLEIILLVSSEAYRFGLDPEQIEPYESISTRLFVSSSQNEQISSIMEYLHKYLDLKENKTQENTNHLIGLAVEYIDEHLSEGNLDLETVSEKVGLSKIYFCKLFHKETGISFTNYLKRERILRAKDLLLHTSMKIYEISYAVGFTNPKYFGYVFKQETGLTPGDFQRLQA